MEDERKSKIIGIAVIVIIIVGIGTMLLISKNMHKQNNNKTTSTSTTTSTTKKTETTTTKIEDTSSFRMVIEDIFTVADGITIDGKISQGTIHKGDKIEILGDNKVITAVVDKIYMLKKEVDSATKDDYISIHIKDVNKSQVSRGQTIASPSTIEATNKFKAKVYINTLKEGGNDTPIYNNYNSLQEANFFKYELIQHQDSLINYQRTMIKELANHLQDEHDCDIPQFDGELKDNIQLEEEYLDSLYNTQL